MGKGSEKKSQANVFPAQKSSTYSLGDRFPPARMERDAVITGSTDSVQRNTHIGKNLHFTIIKAENQVLFYKIPSMLVIILLFNLNIVGLETLSDRFHSLCLVL